MRQQRINKLTSIIVILLIIVQLLGGISLLDPYFGLSTLDFKMFYEQYIIKMKLWDFLQGYFLFATYNKIAKILIIPIIIGSFYLLRLRVLDNNYKNLLSLFLFLILAFEILFAFIQFMTWLLFKDFLPLT